MNSLTIEERLTRLEKFLLPIYSNGTPPELDSLKLSDEERRKQFGSRVRMMRQLLGLTQAELAKKIGVTNQAIATYEKGKREATYKNLIGLSRALNTTTDWLLGTAIVR